MILRLLKSQLGSKLLTTWRASLFLSGGIEFFWKKESVIQGRGMEDFKKQISNSRLEHEENHSTEHKNFNPYK